MFDTLLFRCAICEHDVRDYANRNGRDRHLSPVCRGCESMWVEHIGRPKDGSMMDRRKVMQIAALSEALHSQAGIMKWEAEHGRP